jgi:hypothetical protein
MGASGKVDAIEESVLVAVVLYPKMFLDST